ncbi:putative F-box/FBD/LRR-repeat protein At4g03220 [Ziziphus jujuba]|uniref:F-box/FBD/LRR-repeat protein At4g03220 n=1 Tax=Ziziphus jujuba TaxID=326968 RepID=A0ABM3II40_ZIZJJ|nr:putative F-box/FBD/LRR-repeat protein At4g03220 [Ziziphus jujuba]
MEPQPSSKRFDPLSNLPDSIFQQIISRLDISDISRLSTLSKRCRKLCLSLPSLTISFNNSDYDFYPFSQFFYRFLSMHNGVSLQRLELNISCDNLSISSDEIAFCIGTWILQATKCNVVKIHLEIDTIESFTLPSCFVNCASLRNLVLILDNATLKLPTTSYWPLETLILSQLKISNKLLGEWILRCESLKKLVLFAVSGIVRINISSSSLEYLRIEDITATKYLDIKISTERLECLYILWQVGKSAKHSLRLNAPKLQKFTWKGCVSYYSYEGDFESLRYADIVIIPTPSQNKAVANVTMAKVLETVHRVSWLRVDMFFIEVVELMEEFHSLGALTLLLDDLAGKVPTLASFLKLTPHLNSLKISTSYSSDENKSSYDAEYWEAQNLKFVKSLKEVEMEIHGKHNEIELIKYLLKHAKELENMTVLYSSKVFPRHVAISRKLQQFRKASSSASIYFLPNE